MNRRTTSWLVIAVFLMTVMLPVTPAHAFSVSDLLGQTTGSADASKATGMDTGKGLVNILMGLLLGKFLGNSASTPATGTDKGNPASSLTTAGKELVGFYAEWWGEDTSSYNSLVKNADAIKTIAPFWATMQADGTVTDRGGNDHQAVVKTAQQKDTSVLLLVNNAKQEGAAAPPVHTVLANPELRSKAIDNFEAYIKKYNLDGINVDFEMVPAEDRDNLTAFMRELYARLKPQGYVVSIDVFPKQDENNDVAAAYDYAGLAQYADKIMIMTYDNHGMWSGPGPIADIRWVENSIKYALNFVPKNKLYLGLAAYGYDWSAKGTQSVDFKQIMDLTQQYGQSVQWDAASQSPYFSYTTSEGIAHTVWFENSESLKHKLTLMTKYDIAGAALWKLGEEDPASWPVFKDKFAK